MPRINQIFLSLFLLLAFSGCYSNRLLVQTKYFSNENLASFYVNTPDPLQNYPPVGQSLYIFWRLKNELSSYRDVEIRYRIRLRNKKEITDSFPVRRKKGYISYSIYNEDYFTSGGILTYVVELWADGTLIEEWRQQLWQELITF